MKNPFRNFSIKNYSPIKKDEKEDRYLIFGTSFRHFFRMLAFILILWAIFISMFLGLLHGYSRTSNFKSKAL